MFSAHRSCLCSRMRRMIFFIFIHSMCLAPSFFRPKIEREGGKAKERHVEIFWCYSSGRSPLTATQLATLLNKKLNKSVELLRKRVIISFQNLINYHRACGRSFAQMFTQSDLSISILFDTI